MHDPLTPIRDADDRLRHEFVELARLWQSVRTDWADARAAEFERQHLAELGPSLNRLAAALAEYTRVVRSADRMLRDDDTAANRGGNSALDSGGATDA